MRYLKKSLYLLTSALSVLILSGFLSLRPIAQTPAFAHHTDMPTACYDIPMTGGKLLTDPGSPDSGRLDFNAFGHDYQACIESKNASDNNIKGWTWNSNLGYVSMYCNAGDNEGAGCGGQNYGVVANPTDGNGANDGRVRGFAWGDNIGWISLGCDADSKNMGVNCGAIQYGVRVAKADGESTCLSPDLSTPVAVKKDDAYGYGWSDSVGWINFCGAHMYLFDPPPVITTGTLRYETSAGTLYANGEDYAEIIVEIKNDGVLATGAAPVNATIENVDFSNTLKADQIADSGNGGLAPTTKNDFAWDKNLGAFVAYVRAIAPTNLAHGDNFLRLNSVTVKIDGVSYVLQENNKYFDFNPALAVTQVTSDGAPGEVGDNLFATVGNTTNHEFLVSNHTPKADTVFSNERFFTQLHDCSVTPDEFNFSFGENQSSVNHLNGNGDPDPISINSGVQDGGVCNGIPPQTTITDIEVGTDNAQGTPMSDLQVVDATTSKYTLGVAVTVGNDPSNKTNTSKAFGALVRVSYTVTKGGNPLGTVSYISHKTTDGSLINQAADVRGNVRIDVQKTIIEGNIQKSIGAAAQSKREPFYRAIKRLAASSDANVPISFTTANLNSPAPNLYYYKRPKNATPCQITLSDAAAISPNQNVTIIGEGCDIYIDQNIRFDVNKKQLGIIALEDVRSSATRRGGNIYICSNVTDIVGVNIVADGGVMSYSCGNKNDNTVINQTDGLPVFPLGARSSLKNQLTINGSMISNNTYGGSVQTPPILGDGTRVGPAESYKARLYDVNFLRYANTRSDGNGGECWDATLSETLPQACADNNPLNSSIVNIRYQAPSSDLPIFGSISQ